MTATFTQKLPIAETQPRLIVGSLNRVIEGRTDNYGQLTLEASATSTTFENQFVSENSTITLSPRTANAAAELAAGTAYVSAKANGSFTVTHANNAQDDRTFDIAWIG